jgi:hypothetical protein
MKRRRFIKLIGGAAKAAWPLSTRAQQSSNKIPVVGVLWHSGSAEEDQVYFDALLKAFRDLGYVEGKNIHLDHRFPAENLDRFKALAQELVDEKPDAIIAVTALGAVRGFARGVSLQGGGSLSGWSRRDATHGGLRPTWRSCRSYRRKLKVRPPQLGTASIAFSGRSRQLYRLCCAGGPDLLPGMPGILL